MTENRALAHEKQINRLLSDRSQAMVDEPEDVILDSWNRCIDRFKLSPQGRPDIDILESKALQRLQDELGEFREVADVECRKLYKQTAQSGYIIALTNANGVIINTVGDPALEEVFQKYHFLPGAVWNERCQGTNGMGTCLEMERSVIIHRGDHFFSDYLDLTCTSSPIKDPHGNLIAILDASSFNAEGTKRGQIHTRALVQMAANSIEYQYFQRYFKDASLLSFHPRSEFLGVGTEALLALDQNGRIIAANNRALSHLEVDDRQEFINSHIDEVLSIEGGAIDKSTSTSSPSLLMAHDRRNGRHFVAMVQNGSKPKLRSYAKTRSGAFVTVPPQTSEGCFDLKALAGNDPHMAYNARCARRVVNKNVYILLHGETGTGKEEFAKAIHMSGERADKPFIALNCAAIPESLIESELFGYKAGAFTGARREGMRGCVLESTGGTLFLDEIGDMPLHLQTRLLRVLETKEVLPLGSQTPVKVDLNVVSASHQDLRALMSLGAFRDDLFYRLNGITLTLPPLRERQDIDALLRCVIAIENDTQESISIERKAFSRLIDYPWPGNIRELRNVIRTSLALSDNNTICVADLPKEIANPGDLAVEDEEQTVSVQEGMGESLYTPLESAEREAILHEIEKNRWNMTLTAKKLHMSRSTLYRKLKKYDIPVTPPQ